MKVRARYKLIKCNRLNGNGLQLQGDLIDGQVKTGDFITFHTGVEELTLQIAGVEFSNGSNDGYCVGLIFTYKGEKQRKALENAKIPIQVVEIIGK